MTPRVLVLGDYMIDRYWIGTTDRVSPEAPIPVIKITDTFDSPGGAGNVARNLTTLGVNVIKPWDRSGRHPIKNRLMVGDVQIARWDENDSCSAFEDRDLQSVSEFPVDAIVVADYGKGSITHALRQLLWKIEVPLFIDTKQDPFLYPLKATFFPNRTEYNQFDEYNDLNIVLKLGAGGISELASGQEIDHEPALARFVRSVNGAGDSALAGYVYAKLIGHPRPLAVASRCAANVVEQPYTAVPLGECLL